MLIMWLFLSVAVGCVCVCVCVCVCMRACVCGSSLSHKEKVAQHPSDSLQKAGSHVSLNTTTTGITV